MKFFETMIKYVKLIRYKKLKPLVKVIQQLLALENKEL